MLEGKGLPHGRRQSVIINSLLRDKDEQSDQLLGDQFLVSVGWSLHSRSSVNTGKEVSDQCLGDQP